MPDGPRDRPSALDLQREAKDKRRRRRDCYDELVSKAYARVSAKARQGWVRVLYDVPAFCVGLPPYDREDCARYLARVLRKDGYHAEVYGPVVYVSWDPKEKKHT